MKSIRQTMEQLNQEVGTTYPSAVMFDETLLVKEDQDLLKDLQIAFTDKIIIDVLFVLTRRGTGGIEAAEYEPPGMYTYITTPGGEDDEGWNGEDGWIEKLDIPELVYYMINTCMWKLGLFSAACSPGLMRVSDPYLLARDSDYQDDAELLNTLAEYKTYRIPDFIAEVYHKHLLLSPKEQIQLVKQWLAYCEEEHRC